MVMFFNEMTSRTQNSQLHMTNNVFSQRNCMAGLKHMIEKDCDKVKIVNLNFVMPNSERTIHRHSFRNLINIEKYF